MIINMENSSLESEQQFRIQYHSLIFDPVTREVQRNDNSNDNIASYSNKCICELFGHI